MSTGTFTDFSPALKYVTENPSVCVMHINVYALDGSLIGTEVVNADVNYLMRVALDSQRGYDRYHESTRLRMERYRAAKARGSQDAIVNQGSHF